MMIIFGMREVSWLKETKFHPNIISSRDLLQRVVAIVIKKKKKSYIFKVASSKDSECSYHKEIIT